MSVPVSPSFAAPGSPVDHTQERRNRNGILLAAVVLVIATLLFQQPGLIAQRPHGSFTTELAHMHTIVRFNVVLVATFALTWLLQPVADEILFRLAVTQSTSNRKAGKALAVVLSAAAVAAFLVHFGRWQYGAWDSNILIDVGWRQVLGQQPYVDFVTPTPPFFNWTTALAFRLFGVRWDATLYFAALFAACTLGWAYALLRGLGLRFVASLGTTLTIEIAVMLTGCFWWYNNSTLLIAALFYFSALLLTHDPDSKLAQVSYVLLLALLPLTKPNIAGVAGVGCFALLLFFSRRRGRVLALTLAGLCVCAALVFLLHIPFAAMLATYRGIAKERGGLSAFGFAEFPSSERYLIVLWLALLSAPLARIWRPMMNELRCRHWAHAGQWLFYPLAAVVAIFGLLGNGEQRDVEMPLLVGAIALLSFAGPTLNARWRRYTVALLCAMAASDLYTGAERLRVYTMIKDKFFAWEDNQHTLTEPFFRNMRVSQAMVDVVGETREVVASNPGPVFFGPRMEFEYAALRIPPPLHWTTFFQPGTAFAREQTPALLQSWEDRHFQTLIFLKDEYIFYPEALRNQLRTEYIRDDRHATITVYRRRFPF